MDNRINGTQGNLESQTAEIGKRIDHYKKKIVQLENEV